MYSVYEKLEITKIAMITKLREKKKKNGPNINSFTVNKMRIGIEEWFKTLRVNKLKMGFKLRQSCF